MMTKDYTNILLEILTICTKKGFSFTYENSGKQNYMVIRDDQVILNIPDPDDANLDVFLLEKRKELEDRFK